MTGSSAWKLRLRLSEDSSLSEDSNGREQINCEYLVESTLGKSKHQGQKALSMPGMFEE